MPPERRRVGGPYGGSPHAATSGLAPRRTLARSRLCYSDRVKPLSLPPTVAPAALASLAAIAEHPEDPRVRRFIAFVAAEVDVEAEVDAAPPSPADLAAATPPTSREALVQRMLLAAMLVPPLSTSRLDRLEAHAAALDRADEPALLDLRRALRGEHRRLSASLLARFPPSDRIRRAWRRGAIGERWRIVKAMLRLPDAATAARYRALGDLPESTLGRAFFDHCQRNGFKMPGEPGSLPEPLVFHDMGHALVGEGTDVAGETRMAGFEAGCMGDAGVTMLEFTLLLFNLGARLPTDARPQVGAVDVDALLSAFARGRRSSLDVLGWDPMADASTPLELLRARYAID